MAVVHLQSAQIANMNATPMVTEAPSLTGSKLRVAEFDFTASAGTAGSDAQIVKLPPGKITIWTGLSKVYNSIWPASSTLNVGFAAYEQPDGFGGATLVAANEAAMLSGFVATAAGINFLDTVDKVGRQSFQTLTGLILTLQNGGGTWAGGETANGVIVYSYD